MIKLGNTTVRSKKIKEQKTEVQEIRLTFSLNFRCKSGFFSIISQNTHISKLEAIKNWKFNELNLKNVVLNYILHPSSREQLPNTPVNPMYHHHINSKLSD